jgi:hypothetical protein
MINAETAAVLVNALYLRVAWRIPFIEKATLPVAFQPPRPVEGDQTMRRRNREQERRPYITVRHR